jgi:large subunit ribosomal protein L5
MVATKDSTAKEKGSVVDVNEDADAKVIAKAEAKAKSDAKKKQADANRARAKKAKEEALSALQIAAPGETQVSPSVPPRLFTLYREKVIPALVKEFQFKNAMQVPRLDKVVINCAVKDAVANPKVLDGALEEVMSITGQKAVLTKARKAIATFKVRKGNAVGVMVTLRRARMYEFLDRLLNVAIPRVRDFKGVSTKAFDGRGNYSLGIREQIIFPEVNYDRVDKVRGMTITICTSAKNNEHARAVLTALGMPFRKS